MTEIWKEVPSIPGLFASSLGRIKAEPYEAPMPKGGARKYEMKPTCGHWNRRNKRYIFVRRVNGRSKTYRVAPLICEAFHGRKPARKKIVCLHKDEDARNNKPDNLKWGTQKENLNCPGFITYCRSRTGENSPTVKWRKTALHETKGSPRMAKPKPNGHDKGAEAKTYSQSPTAIRVRLSKERKRKGIVVLRNIVIEPDLAQALISCGWLNALERNNREALLAAIGACLFRVLSAGVTPGERPLIEIDLEALQAAWPWAKPGSQPTAQSAAKALGTLARCAAQVGFDGPEYASRARQMAGIS